MSAAQIAFDMEVGEAFEYRENEYREKRKALAVKAVEERAANPPTLKRYDLMVRHLVLSVCATAVPVRSRPMLTPMRCSRSASWPPCSPSWATRWASTFSAASSMRP